MKNGRVKGLLRAMLKPSASPRLVRRLAQVTMSTSHHLGLIPKGADDTTLAECSNTWGAEMIQILGLRIHLVKVQEVPQGPKLIISNHRSYADILVLLSLVPCRFLAKDEVKQWPILGRAAKAVRTVFVRRDTRTSRRMSREAIEEGLREGSTIAIFPEGTTTKSPGCRPFYRGSFEVAAKVGVPVIPIAIEYASPDIWLGHTAFENFLRTFSRKFIDVFVCIGAPIYPKDIDADDAEAIVEEGHRLRNRAQDWIHRYLVEVWPEANSPLA